MFQVEFAFQIKSMSYSLETKIQIVILRAKSESSIMAIHELGRQEATEIPQRDTITPIYQKFLETDSVENCIPSGRPSTITDDIINAVEEDLNRKPQTSVRKIGRE